MAVIKATAKRIVAPSIQPILGPSFIIPITVDATAATNKIYNIVSDRQSKMNR